MTGVLSSVIQITGILSPKGNMTGQLSEKAQMTGFLTIPETVCSDAYDGEYVVDPDFIGKTLETSGKLMRDDVTVNPILVSKTINISGGNTVYIGGTING